MYIIIFTLHIYQLYVSILPLNQQNTILRPFLVYIILEYFGIVHQFNLMRNLLSISFPHPVWKNSEHVVKIKKVSLGHDIVKCDQKRISDNGAYLFWRRFT